ncbi:MAG: hypothetical protein ACI88H_003398, partial [Cocleimonas sp.]
ARRKAAETLEQNKAKEAQEMRLLSEASESEELMRTDEN